VEQTPEAQNRIHQIKIHDLIFNIAIHKMHKSPRVKKSVTEISIERSNCNTFIGMIFGDLPYEVRRVKIITEISGLFLRILDLYCFESWDQIWYKHSKDCLSDLNYFESFWIYFLQHILTWIHFIIVIEILVLYPIQYLQMLQFLWKSR
jgi:hypothetical protein